MRCALCLNTKASHDDEGRCPDGLSIESYLRELANNAEAQGPKPERKPSRGATTLADLLPPETLEKMRTLAEARP